MSRRARPIARARATVVRTGVVTLAIAAGVAVGLVVSPGTAIADTSAEVADRMFREAKKAMDSGDYPRACPLFEESQRLDPGGGTLLNLALCQEKLGRLATAQKTFEDAAARARADGRADRLGEAHAHLATLSPRVPTLTLTTTRAVAEPRVTLDGQAVPGTELGTRLPLDPGAHTVRFTLGGGSIVTRRLDLREGEATRLSLDEDTLPEPPTVVPVAPTAGGGGAPAPRAHVLATETPAPPTLDVGARPEGSFSTASWVSFGVAAVGLGTATVTGLMALSARSDYSEKCFDERAYCADSAARARGSSARDLAWVSTISLGVGTLALWTGLLLPRRYPVTIAPAGAGLLVRGAF